MAAEAELKPVYLIVSEQKLLVDEALARLRKRVGEHADLDFNMQSFSAPDASVDEIISACNTIPFASDRRLVVVTSIEKLAKDGLDALTAYAQDPSPTTVLALVGEKLAKNTRLYKAVERHGGVVARSIEKREVPAAVRRMFEQRDKTLTPDGAEELVAGVGYDLRALSGEVDKVVAYIGERTEATREDVRAVTANRTTTSIWDYVQALGDRDCRRALQCLAELVGAGDSVFGVHAMGVRAIRDLIAVRALQARGIGSTFEMARELGRPEWQLKRMARQAKSFGSDELVSLLKDAAAREEQMKTSRDARLVLERWIVKTCV